ncbi:DUF7740 domain-containing protein [Pseudomonas denitrificans (nom. rej.)]|uniref:DUF7740 domain-containing protein n=1 Tax=Pseudomonas denitrificans TaxID=43306 RepID=A0A9X7MYN8_PSEDE|nr:hypothetical protein F1C79_08965 [Pseudomonas denitrificans (nom. rej.)]
MPASAFCYGAHLCENVDSAIKATAKRCAKQLPRSKRDILFGIAASSEPLKLVLHIAHNLD